VQGPQVSVYLCCEICTYIWTSPTFTGYRLPVRDRIKYKIALGLLTFKIWTIYFSSKRHHFITATAIIHVVHERRWGQDCRALCHAAPASHNLELTITGDLTDNNYWERTSAPPLPDNCHLAPSAGSGAANAFWWTFSCRNASGGHNFYYFSIRKVIKLYRKYFASMQIALQTLIQTP